MGLDLHQSVNIDKVKFRVIYLTGAGSVLEALGCKRPLVVVINEELMGNHQMELAKQLRKDGHLFYTTCGYVL